MLNNMIQNGHKRSGCFGDINEKILEEDDENKSTIKQNNQGIDDFQDQNHLNIQQQNNNLNPSDLSINLVPKKNSITTYSNGPSNDILNLISQKQSPKFSSNNGDNSMQNTPVQSQRQQNNINVTSQLDSSQVQINNNNINGNKSKFYDFNDQFHSQNQLKRKKKETPVLQNQQGSPQLGTTNKNTTNILNISNSNNNVNNSNNEDLSHNQNIITAKVTIKNIKYIATIYKFEFCDSIENENDQPEKIQYYMIILDVQDNLKKRNSDTKGSNCKNCKKQKQRLLQLQSQICKFKMSLLSSLTHELKTPLNCSLTMLQILKEDKQVPDEIRDNFILPAYCSNEIMESVINDLVDWGSIEMNQFQLQVQNVDLNQLLECILVIFGTQSAINDVQLQLNIKEKLKINSDPNRIKQVLISLLQNAFRVTNQGMIKIEVQDQDQYIKICIIDSGQQIKSNLKESIKDIFSDKFSDLYSYLYTRGIQLGLITANHLAKALSQGQGLEIHGSALMGNVVTFKLYKFQHVDKEIPESDINSPYHKFPNQIRKQWVQRTSTTNNSLQEINQDSIDDREEDKKQINSMLDQQQQQQYTRQKSSSITQQQQQQSNYNNHIGLNSNQSSDTTLMTINNERKQTIKKIWSNHLNQICASLNSIQFEASPLQYRKESMNQFEQQFNEDFEQQFGNSNPRKRKSLFALNQLSNHNTQSNNINNFEDINNQQQKSNNLSDITEQYIEQSNILAQRLSLKKINDIPGDKFNQNYDDHEEQQLTPSDMSSRSRSKSETTSHQSSNHPRSNKQSSGFSNLVLLDNDYNLSDFSMKVLAKQFNFHYSTQQSCNENTSQPVSSQLVLNKSYFNNIKQAQSDANLSDQLQLSKEVIQQSYDQLKTCDKCTRILVVDDNMFNIQSMKMIISTQFKQKLDTATSGQEAIELIKQKLKNSCCKVYQLIIMDVDMPPGKDGYQTSQEIYNILSELEINKHTYIAIHTAFNDLQAQEVENENSLIRYNLKKPCKIDELKQILQSTLQNFQDQQL